MEQGDLLNEISRERLRKVFDHRPECKYVEGYRCGVDASKCMSCSGNLYEWAKYYDWKPKMFLEAKRNFYMMRFDMQFPQGVRSKSDILERILKIPDDQLKVKQHGPTQ
jgi:hypothetical protein